MFCERHVGCSGAMSDLCVKLIRTKNVPHVGISCAFTGKRVSCRDLLCIHRKTCLMSRSLVHSPKNVSHVGISLHSPKNVAPHLGFCVNAKNLFTKTCVRKENSNDYRYCTLVPCKSSSARNACSVVPRHVERPLSGVFT